MKLSVLMLAYNHERFIAQALDSVLMQDVDFEYEIVVGDDCSMDGTRAIVHDYARRYPRHFKLLFHPTNIGMQENFLACYAACTGQYVATLEGDDFWSRNDKLRKQVHFLDAHPSFVACFHKVGQLDATTGTLTSAERGASRDTFALEDFLKFNRVYTPSCVFRNKLIKEFPEWYRTLGMGDWPMHLLLAAYGQYKCLPEEMAIYRIHQQGVWSGKPLEWRTMKAIDMLRHIDQHYGGKYSRQIKASIARQLFILAEDFSRVDRSSALKYIRQALFTNPATVLRKRFLSVVFNTFFGIGKPCQKA